MQVSPQDFKPRLIGIAVVVLLVIVAGFALVSRYMASDYERDMKAWEEKLNLIANHREEEITAWLSMHGVEMKKLAEQPSLQLYLTELGTMDAANTEPPQRSYLRNLLTFSADRLQFTPSNVPLSVQSIPAQIPFESESGLAILNARREMVVATPYLSALPEQVAARLQAMPLGTQSMIDIYKSEKGEAMIGFVQPIFAIQSDPNATEAIGQIVGIKPASAALEALLKPEAITEKTLEVLLVRSDSGNIQYLTSTRDGSVSLEKQHSNDPTTLAEAFAVAHPNAFTSLPDYASETVLATGRHIAGTPWTLVVKINEQEAFAQSNARRTHMLWLLSALVLSTVTTIVAVWYFASSRRAIVASKHFQELADAARSHEQLLSLVAAHQLESVYLLDDETRVKFANKAAAEVMGVEESVAHDKLIADVLGPAKTSELRLHVQAAMAAQEPHAFTHRATRADGSDRIIRTQIVPVAELPLKGEEKQAGVLVSEQDITDVVTERERAERTHQQLISTLVAMVDKRDPNAANHSQLVSELADELAQLMECDAVMHDTARTAGLLLNTGKIIVPEHVLTSTDKLEENDLRSIRESVYASAQLLSAIHFEGPVAETLKQSLECVDGSGPMGLKGEHILMSARIVAVANALVGMISPRSYRDPLTVDEACKQLLQQVDTLYDRKVVIALVNYLENQGGIERLMSWVDLRRAA